MNKLLLTDEQLHLVRNALDFYARVGVGQFGVIKEHPTFENHLYKHFSPKREPVVGDSTPQGKVLEIKNGKALISGSVKNGMWNEKHEWKKLKDVELSTDWGLFHETRDKIDEQLNVARNMLYQDDSLGKNGNWGIGHKNVDDTCRMAFDIVQVIRHEFWKRNPSRSFITVDSSIHFSHRKDDSSGKIECKLDPPEYCWDCGGTVYYSVVNEEHMCMQCEKVY